MAACYTPDARFTDPVFDLTGAEVGAMWTMFCERGRDLALTWRDVRADDAAGAAHWEPRYTFSVTGRPVHNVHRRGIHVPRRPDRHPSRHVRPLALEPHGARVQGRAARLDAVRAKRSGAGQARLDTWIARRA